MRTTINRTAITFHNKAFRMLWMVMLCLLISLPASAEPKKKVSGASSAAKPFTVVIDAGHGGHDKGAIDNGVSEKDINLGVAQKLAALLKKNMKDIKVVMTRDDDTFISLQERANIANRNRGDLFISIHTNSVDKNNPNRKSVAGTSVYALGPQKDDKNLQVARRENSVIELEDNYHRKYSGFDPSKDESYIIFEMSQKKNLGNSLKFANKAQKQLVSTAGRKDRGVKQAGFWVLWATSMPAVLVELDFICNPTEAAFLASDAGQQKLAKSLLNAIEEYVKNAPDVSMATEPTSDKNEAAIAMQNTQTESEESGTHVIAANTKKEERQTHAATSNSKYATSKPRRRRSEQSKRISDNRAVETDRITIKNETDFLAVKEENKTESVTAKVVSEDTKPSKGKKAKNKKKTDKRSKASKDNKSKDTKTKDTKAQAARSDSKDTPKPKKTDNKKKYVIKARDNSQTIVADNTGSASRELNSQNVNGQSTRSASEDRTSTQMVYKILLLSSETEISNTDPAFCGIVPNGMYKENGKYKYTYGSSRDRREIEQKLLEVKTLLPEALIVVRNE